MIQRQKVGYEVIRMTGMPADAKKHSDDSMVKPYYDHAHAHTLTLASMETALLQLKLASLLCMSTL